MSKTGVTMNSNAPVIPGCGLQICSHPACWDEERHLLRTLARNKYSPQNIKHTTEKNTKPEFDDTSDGLPTLSILNTGSDLFAVTQPHFSISSCHSDNAIKEVKSIKSKASEILSKLHLDALNEEPITGFTPAPANTPLHSSHLLDETPHGVPLSVYSSSKRNKAGNTIGTIKNLQLNQHYAKKKKIFVWQSPQSRVKSHQDERVSSKKPHTTKLMLPADGLPVISNESSWHSTRTKKPKKNLHISSHQLTTMSSSEDALKQSKSEEKLLDPHITVPSGFELDKLKSVPLDVLLRVVRMALNSKVITIKQATVLLLQVTGQQVTVERVESSINILLRDTGKPPPKTLMQNELPSIAPFSVFHHDDPQSHMMIDRTASSEILSLLDGALASLPVYTTNKSLGQPKSHKVSRITQTDGISSMPPRPFRYARYYQDMSLGPAPTPPPRSPSTERDSQYDEMVGGSTLMVNLSKTPSLTTQDLSYSIDSDASIKGRDPDKPASSSRSSVKSSWPQVEESLPVEEENPIKSPHRNTNESPGGKRESISRARSRNTTSQNSDKEKIRPEVSRSVAIARSPDPPPPSPEVPPDDRANNRNAIID